MEINIEKYQAELKNYIEIVKPDFIAIFNLRKSEPIIFSQNYNLEFTKGRDETIYEIINCIDENQIEMIRLSDEKMMTFIMNNIDNLKNTVFELNFTARLIENQPRSLVRRISFVARDENQQDYICFNALKDMSDLHGISKMPKINIRCSDYENNEFVEKLNQLKKKLNDILKKNINLTNREQEILNLIADGKTSQEIADTLFISIFTVNTHRQNLLKKFNVNNTNALIKLV